MNYPYCIGITGASGAVYAMRLLDVLLASGHDVHLSISPSGQVVLAHELGVEVDLANVDETSLPLEDARAADDPGRLSYFHHQDYMVPMASGQARSGGMVICPCSGGTLSAIARSASGNLIQRAAEVHLKERRKLILVPRETPLSLSQIENMRLVTQAGAVVLPASPGWYSGVKDLGDLVDFVVQRICDQLGIETTLVSRWGSESGQ